MKLWCYSYRDDDSPSGTVNWYFGSKRDLNTAKRQLELNPPSGYQVFSITEELIPTRKKDMIFWLNHQS